MLQQLAPCLSCASSLQNSSTTWNQQNYQQNLNYQQNHQQTLFKPTRNSHKLSTLVIRIGILDPSQADNKGIEKFTS